MQDCGILPQSCTELSPYSARKCRHYHILFLSSLTVTSPKPFICFHYIIYGPYPFPYVTVIPCYPQTSWDANRSFLPIMFFLFLLLLAQPQYSFHVCFLKAQEASRHFYFLLLSFTCFYNFLLCSTRFYMFLWGGFKFSMNFYWLEINIGRRNYGHVSTDCDCL